MKSFEISLLPKFTSNLEEREFIQKLASDQKVSTWVIPKHTTMPSTKKSITPKPRKKSTTKVAKKRLLKDVDDEVFGL